MSVKISDMPDASTLVGDEVAPLVQSGDNVKSDLDTLKAFFAVSAAPDRIVNDGGSWIVNADGSVTADVPSGKAITIKQNGVTRIQIDNSGNIVIITTGASVFLTYSPAAPANWNTPAPFQLADAVDRLAAANPGA